MYKTLKKIAYSFYSKEIYINFLTHVSEIPDKENERYCHAYNLFMKNQIRSQYGYDDRQLDLAKKYLINSGYLIASGGTQSLFITEEGKGFLQNYYRFRMLGKWGKFTTIFNKNFIAILSILSLLVSFASFFKK